MAEEDSGQERSEAATPKRRQDAREKGDIARSRELNTAAVLIAGASGMVIFGQQISAGLAGMMSFSFQWDHEILADPDMMLDYLGTAILDALWVVLPVLVMTLIAALVGPIALGGWVLSFKSAAPKLDRIDPVKGLKRMFSARSLMELVKAFAKFLVVVTMAVFILNWMAADILALGRHDAVLSMAAAVKIVGWSVLGLCASTLLISMVDVPFQLWDHNRKLKMTRQEIKDELKNTEGRPEVRSRIRRLQHEISQRRMMSAVPEADVVITNPEHYAVALRYNSNEMGAPVLVAKGADLVAQKIREVATANEVPVITAPPLARAVFYSTELDREIPAGLYVAVAQVLAYVFQLKRYRKGKGERPQPLKDLPIPENLRKD